MTVKLHFLNINKAVILFFFLLIKTLDLPIDAFSHAFNNYLILGNKVWNIKITLLDFSKVWNIQIFKRVILEWLIYWPIFFIIGYVIYQLLYK